ncbi:uncharacterized protein LOC116187503 [Punica granatum]|uniref:FLZ-type domain-containing protein n=2 Tax=Punica granatum TaxID=22663 RepID=A0A218W1Z7_PUNGR|nr:uncharacterized protein LOC116187503 [Punica granatum]OWM66857.1 hypothetical protein CDL15_Pgr002652 [Punica granatum]PKI56554.1 hypothetical protein CRG98_023080 [Punica granatum]
MSVKRSRISRSSSSTDVVLSRRSSPAADPPELRWAAFYGSLSTAAAAARAARLEAGRPRPGILSVSSPPVVEEELTCEPPNGNFLEKCYYCKKMIGEDDEVFMYGHLRAFCTSDCRDKQIAMDSLRGISSGRSSVTRSDCCKNKKN